MENQKLVKRIDGLEATISELVKIVNALKRTIDNVQTTNNYKPARPKNLPVDYIRETRIPARTHFPIGDVIGVADEQRANPWALEAALALLDDRIEKRAIKSSFSIYRPTLNALKLKAKALSADEVAKETGRKRNTESTYLNRLYRAGLIHRTKRGTKVLFALGNAKDLYQVFGATV